MGRGRKPKPTPLKALEGNAGKRPLNTDEPKFAPVSHLNPPDWLNAVAKSEWRRVAPQLYAQKMFSECDHANLAAYCLVFSRWLQAEQLVQQQIDSANQKPSAAAAGALELPLAMEFKTPQGYAQQIPQIGIANTYLDKMRALAAEFGFTPAARARMRVEIVPPPSDADEFFDKPDLGGQPNGEAQPLH